MPNPWGRMGAPMIQPTKDQLRRIIHDLREERDEERLRRKTLERKMEGTEKRLDEAARLLGRQLIEASIEARLPSPEPQRFLRGPSPSC